MSRPALSQALSRIRLGRAIGLADMARALGMSSSELHRVETGRSVSLDVPDDIAAALAERGFASDPEGRTKVIETPVAVPAGFADNLDQALGLSAEERATLDAGLAGLCEPPFPTDAEHARILSLLKRRR